MYTVQLNWFVSSCAYGLIVISKVWISPAEKLINSKNSSCV